MASNLRRGFGPSCRLCLQHSFPRWPHGSLPLFIQLSTQRSLQKCPAFATWYKTACPAPRIYYPHDPDSPFIRALITNSVTQSIQSLQSRGSKQWDRATDSPSVYKLSIIHALYICSLSVSLTRMCTLSEKGFCNFHCSSPTRWHMSIRNNAGTQ